MEVVAVDTIIISPHYAQPVPETKLFFVTTVKFVTLINIPLTSLALTEEDTFFLNLRMAKDTYAIIT